LKIAQLPAFSGGGVRLAMFVAGVGLWIAWTLRWASRHRATAPVGHDLQVVPLPTAAPPPAAVAPSTGVGAFPLKHALILATAPTPMAAYVYGALRLDWGFNELAGAFLLATLVVGTFGGLGLGATVDAFLEGAASLVSPALLIGAARSISLVLEDGRIVDTILNSLATPLARMPAIVSALLQIPVHALVHVAVPSVSGPAVLTMPLFVPLADLLGLSRQVSVLAYQAGAGLTEMITPTNGALMAVLLAAKVPYQTWLRFLVGGLTLLVLVGV